LAECLLPKPAIRLCRNPSPTPIHPLGYGRSLRPWRPASADPACMVGANRVLGWPRVLVAKVAFCWPLVAFWWTRPVALWSFLAPRRGSSCRAHSRRGFESFESQMPTIRNGAPPQRAQAPCWPPRPAEPARRSPLKACPVRRDDPEPDPPRRWSVAFVNTFNTRRGDPPFSFGNRPREDPDLAGRLVVRQVPRVMVNFLESSAPIEGPERDRALRP
jgi:hypothetical protein